MSVIPQIALNNGTQIPQFGFGLYKVEPESVPDLTGAALDAGYRHFDTASMYGNEEALGHTLREAIQHTDLRREDLFVTTKVWNDQQGRKNTLKAFKESLKKLQTDYVDLYLIHWPAPGRGLFVETYKAMEEILASGRAKAIGVSNFQISHLETLLQSTSVVPAVNQVELHPWLQQRELREFHAAHGIVTEAWSPLARGRILQDPVLAEIAAAHDVSVAQVALRWQTQIGNVTFPKASSAPRIRENVQAFSFTLSEEDLVHIGGLDRDFRSGSHPDQVN